MCEEHSPFSEFIPQKLQGKHRRMPPDWLPRIFEQAKALGIREIIPSTMGEPLMYRYFDEIIALCRQYGFWLNLTTNGTFPKLQGRTASEWAELLVPITSDVKISWNGATKETAERIMRKINFEEAVENVRAFAAVRDAHRAQTGHHCRLTFQLTFMQNNMHELAEIIRLAASLGVDRVKGHQLWAHFEQIKNLSFRQNAQSIAQWNRYVEEAYAAQERFRLPSGQKVILENIVPLQAQEDKIVPADYECPFLQRELWISATGKISPCCAPDEQRDSLGDFGNIQTHSLSEAIASEAYQHLVQNYKQHPLCQQCNMRKKA
jgi:MoaA/NifB/PqqE/SkfB family radical SAM enzyme